MKPCWRRSAVSERTEVPTLPVTRRRRVPVARYVELSTSYRNEAVPALPGTPAQLPVAPVPKAGFDWVPVGRRSVLPTLNGADGLPYCW